jgi:hypothetical protein
MPNDAHQTTNVGRVFRFSDGSIVRVFRDVELHGDPLHGMDTIPLGPVHLGMKTGTIWPGEAEQYDWKELDRIAPEEPMQRIEWSCPERRESRNDGITVIGGEQWLTISVCEEQAVDSYNHNIETEVSLNREAAEALYAALGRALGHE